MKKNIHSRKEKMEAFGRLLDIMDELREKCPWDQKQTIQSLRHLTIEEVYELSDAIMEDDLDEIKKEIGDLLLHMVFYAKIGQEKGAFDVADVLHGICEKLIVRHPHIYGEVKAESEEEVKRNWELIKLKEKGKKQVLGGVPSALPALVKAMRIQEKARGAGFDWEDPSGMLDKVAEELGEFREVLSQQGKATAPEAEQEFGDLLFSLVNYARFAGINPETALEHTNKKFIKRFNYLEQQAKEDGKQMGKMSLAEMDAYWEAAKKLE